MTWANVLIVTIVVGALAEPPLLIWGLMHFLWRPVHERFPGREPDGDAITKRFQSFRLGIMNLGFSIHVAVDENHLHLTPAGYLRVFGARPLSIPWESIAIQKRSRSKRWITAKVDRWTVVGPAWCLELAE